MSVLDSKQLAVWFIRFTWLIQFVTALTLNHNSTSNSNTKAMATADTVTLSEPHAPKEASIKAFQSIESELKHELVKLRHDHDSKPFLHLLSLAPKLLDCRPIGATKRAVTILPLPTSRPQPSFSIPQHLSLKPHAFVSPAHATPT